jgi:hypothetical protein
MLRGIYRDPQRFVAQYWNRYPGIYFTGDGAKLDEEGYFWLLGRVDDVMNISGHRVSTMEVESALVDHPLVAEAAVIGRPHEIKGQAIAAFVTIKDGNKGTKELMEEIKAHVTKKIGALARPDDLIWAADLPKTRSGKIMRRLLRDIAEGKALGDTTTLADPAVVSRLKEQYGEEEEGSAALRASREEEEGDAGEQRGEDEAAVDHVAEEGRHPDAGFFGDRLDHEVGGIADIRVGPHCNRAHADGGQDGVRHAHHVVAEAEALAEGEERQIGGCIVEE